MRIYLIPKVIGGPHNELDLAYQEDYVGQSYTLMPFGRDPLAIVGFPSLPAESAAALALHADVVAFPDTESTAWNSPIGGELAALQAALEAAKVPAGWIQSTFTWRTVLRLLAAMTQFLQRYGSDGWKQGLFSAGVTLDTRFNQLPTGVQNRLRTAASTMGYDTSALTGNSTVRAILKNVADQWGVRDLILSGNLL
jgi:hypothetical protein